MTSYASAAPRFKPPKYKQKTRLIPGNLSNYNKNRKVSEFNIVLFGCGSIGSRTLQTILENRQLHSKLFNQRYNIGAIFDSSGFVYNGSRSGETNNTSINDSTLINILEWKSKNKNSLRTFRNIGYYYNDFHRIKPCLLGTRNTILIDTSNESANLQDIFMEHSQNGGGIVMANKKQLSSSQHIFDNVTAPHVLPRVGYEATVGAALPFINTLQNLLISGDNVYKLQGILSGSIGWMLTKWQRMKNSNLDYDKQKGLFADIMEEAFQCGLTEPDPRDDILGIDNARKAVILARTLGINCNLDDVLKNTVSLLPIDREKLLNMTPNEFTNRIKEIDENELEQYLLENCVDNTGHSGNKRMMNLKYITSIDTNTEEIKIELRNFDQDQDMDDEVSLFKHVYGTNNILQYITDCYPSNNPLTIQGVSTGKTNSVNSIMTDLYKVGNALG